jgi:2-polyprenyl-3-methyl-5-hydroxy-6-metoxy-1,4-benzoquinol methylase
MFTSMSRRHKFSQRSTEKELLDRDDIPFEDIKQNMKELDFINTWLGGHKITVDGLRHLLLRVGHPNAFGVTHPQQQRINIYEIGCGGGDNLRVIKKYCEQQNINASFTGIDINPHCITFARSRKENEGIAFICSDYQKINFAEQPHIIFTSLFCHHFTNEELKQQFEWMKENTQLGFFVNDLQRHWLAYYSIKFLTQLFSKSYLVKNDAPLSVLRGFTKKEFSQILNQSSIINYQLTWKWAFKWLLIYKHDQ